jgi:hypothetical protein
MTWGEGELRFAGDSRETGEVGLMKTVPFLVSNCVGNHLPFDALF